MISNLLKNAVKFTNEGGTISIMIDLNNTNTNKEKGEDVKDKGYRLV